MNTIVEKIGLASIIILMTFLNSYSQEDSLDSLFEQDQLIQGTFKTTRLVNAHSVETTKKKSLDFRVTHHFGDIGGNAGGGHTFWGLDNASDIRIALEYGINDRMAVGLGRSKVNELIDGYLKYRLIRQTENKIPVSLTVMVNTGFTPSKNSDHAYDKFVNRFSYISQAILARKFSNRLSFQLMGLLLHRNFIYDVEDKNDLLSIGAGGRFKITKRFAVLADYYYTFSKFRRDRSSTYSYPLGIGMELETGGHVFQIFFTNNAGIVENNYISNTTSHWTKGEFKLGFNISRVF